MTHFLGLRINGIEGSNDTLDTWSDRLRYVLLVLFLVVLAVFTERKTDDMS